MREMHQSFGVMMLAVGIVVGMILGVVFRINFLNSPWWILFIIGIFLLMYFWPRFLTVGACLIAGMVLAFFRVAGVLSETMEASQTSKTEITVESGTEELVIGARDWFAERIKSELPEREANLGMSYLLGMKTGLDTELSNNLKMVGLTHIVVASGAHLSILVEVARKIFGKVSRFSGLMFSVLFILFFMAMVGWTPSILRAGLMAILTLLAWWTGRKVQPLRLILFVAAVTLVIDPLFLTNLGWLLSFASYAGIMLLGPGITKFFYGDKKPKFIASVVLTTLAATLMTLPITLFYFGQVSLISVVANLLILPTLPYAMGMVFLTGVVAGVPGISSAVSFLTEKMLDFHILTVEFFGKMEQFLIKIDRYEPRVLFLYLFLLIPIGMWVYSKVKNRQIREKVVE